MFYGKINAYYFYMVYNYKDTRAALLFQVDHLPFTEHILLWAAVDFTALRGYNGYKGPNAAREGRVSL